MLDAWATIVLTAAVKHPAGPKYGTLKKVSVLILLVIIPL